MGVALGNHQRCHPHSIQALDGVEGESQPGAILILAQLANQFMDLSEQVRGRASGLEFGQLRG